MLKNLQKYKIYLASNSPRRRELMNQLRIPYSNINIAAIDESYPDNIPALEVPAYIANKKADAYLSIVETNEMIITADTVVVLGDKVIGKPKDTSEAVAQLLELSGKTHKVVTAVCILTKDKRTVFSNITDVTFGNITPEEAEYYVENYLPLDKAGSYGIQEWIGCVAVAGIHGSFYNVMGLPVHQLYHELKNF